MSVRCKIVICRRNRVPGPSSKIHYPVPNLGSWYPFFQLWKFKYLIRAQLKPRTRLLDAGVSVYRFDIMNTIWTFCVKNLDMWKIFGNWVIALLFFLTYLKIETKSGYVGNCNRVLYPFLKHWCKSQLIKYMCYVVHLCMLMNCCDDGVCVYYVYHCCRYFCLLLNLHSWHVP